MDVNIIITGIFGIVATVWGIVLSRKYSLEQQERQRKIDMGIQDKEIKAREESARREHLVKLIYNETLPPSTRALASKEYIDKGYNSSTIDYIYKQSLLDHLPLS